MRPVCSSSNSKRFAPFDSNVRLSVRLHTHHAILKDVEDSSTLISQLSQNNKKSITCFVCLVCLFLFWFFKKKNKNAIKNKQHKIDETAYVAKSNTFQNTQMAANSSALTNVKQSNALAIDCIVLPRIACSQHKNCKKL